MHIHLRRALTVAAIVAIAGCSGTTPGQSPSPGTGASATFVHRGVPFASAMLHHNLVSTTTGTYPTKKSLVFEADQEEAAVNIYQTKKLTSNPAPIATIHAAHGCPYGLVMNKKGTLFVADNCPSGSFTGDVEVFSKGSTTLKTTITDGIHYPLGLAMDSHGTLYVSNYPASITEYPAGSTTPSKTITGGGMDDPFGMAVDTSGNLYIADFGADAVFELPAGGSSVTNLGLSGLGEPIGLAFDHSSGYLWETGGGDNVVNVYDLATGTSPIESFKGSDNPYAISAQNSGKPKGEVVISDTDTHDVYAYKPGQYTPYATLSDGVELPTGLLIREP